MDVSRWMGSSYATFTGSWKQTAPDILEVTNVTSGSILQVEHMIYGSGISPGTKITAILTGTGKVGTYRLSKPQTLFYSNVKLYSGFYPGSAGNADTVIFPANSGS